jgi:hypothetical protein
MATCLNVKIISLKSPTKLKAENMTQKNRGEFGDSFFRKNGDIATEFGSPNFKKR